MARPPYQPERGHFIHMTFDPQAGVEQAGRRPALVLSPMTFNIATGLAWICPITNQVKGGGFEVPINIKTGVTGAILCDQMSAMDWLARGAGYASNCPNDLLEEVMARLEAVLHNSC